VRTTRTITGNAGLTLAELLISATVSCLVVVLAAQAWKPASESILALQDRAITVSEMRMAVESLMQDFGAATSATAGVDGSLLILREETVAELEGGSTGAGDAGIQYTLADGQLTRHDVASGRERVVASHLRLFELTDLGSGSIEIKIGGGSGLGDRKVSLVWQP
jgi:hypothetical protein